ARAVGEVPGEVLAAHRLRSQLDGVLPQLTAHGGFDERDLVLGVDHRRDASAVLEVDLDPVRAGDAVDEFGQHLGDLVPSVDVEAAQSAAQNPFAGDDVGGVSGADLSPDERDRMSGVDEPSQGRGQVGGELAQRVDEVLGQVRSGGVPAVTGQADDDGVSGGGDGADARAHLADVDVRVAVDGESSGTCFVESLQRDAGTDQRGQVHIVAAGVGDSGHGGAEVLVDEVVDGQGIDIGAQSEGQRSIADLAHDSGALEAPRLQA